MSWALPHQLSNRKMPYTLNSRLLLLKAFSKSSLFQSDSSLYQVDLITSSTPYRFTFQLCTCLFGFFLPSFLSFSVILSLSLLILPLFISSFFDSTLCSVSNIHTCMGTDPSTGVWEAYQQLHSQKKNESLFFSSYQLPIDPQLGAGPREKLLYLCQNIRWYDLVQVLCR